ncbi:glycogen synthase GlgA [Pseudomonas jinjuensis]|uniref:Glycogen synthase n=1 Tax=Pseudomonas jinjuensis TaxID=198616 RepID=A0A1H0CYW8_9PSED|nr:glycogen synthase GlgA [Pseudomonas jinjuensis]SDN63059.1 starch synthase [Pseudomonas jinjuensis]
MGNLSASARLQDTRSQGLPPFLHPVEGLPPQQRSKILFVTPEFTDFIKAGGLGDVSAALPRALMQHHDIRVLIPGYRQVLDCGRDCRVIGRLPGLAAIPGCEIGEIVLDDGLPVYVLICPELYDRPGTPYGDLHGGDWADNHIRFARLSLAAADLAAGFGELGWCPDLLHVNDWPSALAPAYMAWRGQATPSILTIHNLAYQGCYPLACRAELGLPDEAALPESAEFYGRLSFLKAGIAHASHITTVSETYAREITTEEFGCGMQGILAYRRDRGQLSGITNGIDGSWQPNADPHLVEGFDTRRMAGKRANADYVEQRFGLCPGTGPLFAVVSRLVQQKGVDLTLAITDDIVDAGGRLVVIGRGEPELEDAMLELGSRHKGRVGVHVGFCETEARRMFAGSDFLLMPSRYEPCGLSQMYAQCFGSLPIARSTGGLADTIEDGVTGFLFREENPASYFDAVRRALNIYRHPELLNAMRCKAMEAPQQWDQSVEPYAHLYSNLLRRAARHAGAMAR